MSSTGLTNGSQTWWDQKKMSRLSSWDKRNQLCAFGVLNTDEDLVKASTSATGNSQIEDSPVTKLSSGIEMGCKGMIGMMCGTALTGAKCMHW